MLNIYFDVLYEGVLQNKTKMQFILLFAYLFIYLCIVASLHHLPFLWSSRTPYSPRPA